jgi:4-alpha-glucanotransferase
MQIEFYVYFQTQWGSSLNLLLQERDELGNVCLSSQQMSCGNNSVWSCKLTSNSQLAVIRYQYELVDSTGKSTRECGNIREVHLPKGMQNVKIYDLWRDEVEQSPFASTLFSRCFFKRETHSIKQKINGNLCINLFAPQIEPAQYVAIVGNQEVLGSWDVNKKLSLDESRFPVWSITLDVKQINFPLEYKFVLVDSTTDEVLAWEEGENRKLAWLSSDEYHIINDENLQTSLPRWRASGVAIPVFSLRSKQSFGVGDFHDLKLMVDWAKITGQRMIQILPINDTTLTHSNTDSYPYNALSVYALHPLYLHVESIGKITKPKLKAYFNQQKKILNAQAHVDYQQVMRVKWEYFRELYNQSAEELFKTPAFKQFFKNNESWLVPYAAFSYLRDKYGSAEFTTWSEHSAYNPQAIQKLASKRNKDFDQIAIYYFLQFHLDKQLTEAHEYALQQGVAIKGDIPIGVSPNSVEVWTDPELFNTHAQAGAPPDDFAVSGQNWSFPTYNWDRMEKDQYAWWKQRFHHLEKYFDAYRIDHMLGFFRIWEIPENDVWALKGQFNPALPLTIEEIAKKGLSWDKNRFLKPYLKKHILQAVFGDLAAHAIRQFFEVDGELTYRFKPEFDTQKKIQAHFETFGTSISKENYLFRDGLFQLHSEVLFVEDTHQSGTYHPRITVQKTLSYQDLPESDRRLIHDIYVDYFYVRHNSFWKEQAMKKLPALIASNKMLACGEDLGMLPDSVPEVMQKLEILSLEIQRMPKQSNKIFALPQDAPYLSVCSTSTHDMTPIRAWWLEHRQLTQQYYNEVLGLEGEAPEQCEPWIAEQIIRQHVASNAMWVILPWQDWMAMDGDLRQEDPWSERINIPSDPQHFWSYRMHMNLEDLLKATSFNEKIKKINNNRYE